MAQNLNNNNEWLKSLKKPSNLIALGALFVSIWGGFTFFANRQNLDVKDNCQVRSITQNTGEKKNLDQSVSCSNDAIIEDVKQE